MMTGLLHLFLLWSPARAGCDLPSVHVAAAERAVLAVERATATAELEQALAAMGCNPPVEPETLARYWLASAVLAQIEGAEARSKEAFVAAWRVAPAVWLPNYGAPMEQLRDGAVRELSKRSMGRLNLSQPPQHSEVWVDGRQVAPPLDLEAGLHLIQLVPAGGVPYFQRAFVLPAGEELSMTVDAVEPAVPPPPPPVVDAATSVAKAAPEAPPPPAPDPARVEAARSELLTRARRDWGEIDSKTAQDETGAQAERLLQQYLDRYGSVGVRVEGVTIPVQIPQAVEARRRLDSLPARRAEAERVQREKAELDRQLSSTTGEGPRFLGLTADLEATLLQGRSSGADAVVAELGGVGPSLHLGVGLGLTEKLGLRAQLGGVFVGSSAPEPGDGSASDWYVDPTGDMLAFAEGDLLLTLSLGRLDLGAGPLFAAGSGQSMGQRGDGGQDVPASIRGTLTMGGATAQLDYTIPLSTKIALGPVLSGSMASAGETLYAWGALGVSVGFAPR